MYKIPTNQSGTRSVDVTDGHMRTIQTYSLLENLQDSNGIIDEDVLDKLRLTCRSILETQKEVDRDLMDLCLDVIYHPNMKAKGLQNLLEAYKAWDATL